MKLGSSPDFLEKRGRGLELYLSTLLNEKAYMKENRILFVFVDLSDDNYRLIKESEVSFTCKKLKALFLYQEFLVENNVKYNSFLLHPSFLLPHPSFLLPPPSSLLPPPSSSSLLSPPSSLLPPPSSLSPTLFQLFVVPTSGLHF